MSGLGNEAVHGHNPTNHATLADAVVESVSSALGRGAEARLPHKVPAPLNPRRRSVELHGIPSAVEKELDTALQGDPTERLGHPGLDCSALPHNHVHRLPDRRDLLHRLQQPRTESPVPHGPAGEVHGVYGTGGLAGRDAFAGGVEGEIAPVHGASSAHEALSDQGIPVTESD